jgi:hypothetical protein
VATGRERLAADGVPVPPHRNHSFLGVNLDYPEAKVQGLTWLGKRTVPSLQEPDARAGPRGVDEGLQQRRHGVGRFQYPEFKGYHANTYRAGLRTTEGTITMVAAQENLFLARQVRHGRETPPMPSPRH